MILGPVFQAELLRTARRRRYYLARFLYGIVLFFIVWIGYASATAVSSTPTIDQAAEFAEYTFLRFAVFQLVATLLMIPALFGGTIADEKQRKTLHYLMASRLSSFEIIVDKLLGRAPHLAVLLALGLPVICLLGLFGGVPPEYVAVAYLTTFSTATMAVALTVLISTLARKVRQAVLIAYVFLLGWQIVPTVVYAIGLSPIFPVTSRWLRPINDWVGATTPMFVYVTTLMRMGGVGGLSNWLIEQITWMVGLQLGAAALLVWLAVWQLRPAFRRHEATPPRRKWFERAMAKKPRKARPPRWYDRPECGADAMSWKERHFARTDILTKLVVLPATILVTVFLVFFVVIDQDYRGSGTADDRLVESIRIVSAWYVGIWLLAVAGSSASSVAIEREEDTWISLTSTPLTGWEILRGKALGATWAQRGFGAVPLGIWTIGLLTGTVHPLGFLASVLAFAVATAMVAAIGIHASIRASNTSKAMATAIGRLFVLYGYPVFMVTGFTVGNNGFQSYQLILGLPPMLTVAPLMSYREFSESWRLAMAFGFKTPVGGLGAAGLAVILIYTLIATVLTLRCVRLFDRWLDRPALADDSRAIRKPTRAEEIEPALQS